MEIEFKVRGGKSLKFEIDRETERFYWSLIDCHFEATNLLDRVVDLHIRLGQLTLASLTLMDYRPTVQHDISGLIERARSAYFFQDTLEKTAGKIVDSLIDNFLDNEDVMKNQTHITRFLAERREDIYRILQESIVCIDSSET